ncbi:MAG: hypothetical protein H6R01_1411 [Burkholderiaceae bacterium]|nr:hypothetical protein [Burkholderiaceae bacterium]
MQQKSTEMAHFTRISAQAAATQFAVQQKATSSYRILSIARVALTHSSADTDVTIRH